MEPLRSPTRRCRRASQPTPRHRRHLRRRPPGMSPEAPRCPQPASSGKRKPHFRRRATPTARPGRGAAASVPALVPPCRGHGEQILPPAQPRGGRAQSVSSPQVTTKAKGVFWGCIPPVALLRPWTRMPRSEPLSSSQMPVESTFPCVERGTRRTAAHPGPPCPRLGGGQAEPPPAARPPCPWTESNHIP